MSYWFGYRVFDRNIDLQPRSKILMGSFNSYKEAKAEKQKNKAPDIEQTAIFQASTKDEAIELLEKEQFSRI